MRKAQPDGKRRLKRVVEHGQEVQEALRLLADAERNASPEGAERPQPRIYLSRNYSDSFLAPPCALPLG